jgi:uncharacterized membrane protein YdjX (TVP38/TMEM64 family)
MLRRFTSAMRLTLLALVVGSAWWYAHTGSFSPDLIGRYRIEHPWLAVAMFLSVYALSVLACLPTIALNLGAGYLWGGLLGGAYATFGVTAGGLAAFAVMRAFAGKGFEMEVSNPALAAMIREFRASDWRLVAFVRLNPIFPTGPVNYLLGLTALRPRTFAWSTFVFLLPPSVAVAYIGDTLQTFTASQPDASDYLRNLLIVSAAITALAGVKVAWRFVGIRHERS